MATADNAPRLANSFCMSASAAGSRRRRMSRLQTSPDLISFGIYPGYAEAYRAWKAAARRSVDNPQLRYFIVHISRLLDPTPRHLEPGTP